MKCSVLWACLLSSVLLLSSCVSTHTAPVVDLRNQLAEQRGYHVAQRGETLYFIAWRFNRDFLDLAQINHLKAPYHLQVGQKIYLNQTAGSKAKRMLPVANPKAVKAAVIGKWLVPTKGKLINRFSSILKGINIAGKYRQPVVATAAGTVVYAGAGLRGYGNLLLIKHNALYLSAYAHNAKLLVKEGDKVKAGQQIAEMGSSGANRVMLHFELRKRGKPVKIAIKSSRLYVGGK